LLADTRGHFLTIIDKYFSIVVYMQVNSKHEPWQEALRLMSKCPICSHSYPTEAVKFFLKKETSSLVHSTCSNCQSAFVAMIMTLGKGVSSVGMVTDLDFKDVQRLYDKQSITLDEVIEGYEMFEKGNWVLSN